MNNKYFKMKHKPRDKKIKNYNLNSNNKKLI